jgi:hypothetical protein
VCTIFMHLLVAGGVLIDAVSAVAILMVSKFIAKGRKMHKAIPMGTGLFVGSAS